MRYDRVVSHDRPNALTAHALRALRDRPVQGLSRRALLRRSLGGAIAIWLAELAGGTIGFLWPTVARGCGGTPARGTSADAANSRAGPGGPGFGDGAPAHFLDARAFVVLVDTTRNQFVPGTSPDGSGGDTNVRTLYQRCTHLGCTPNFCPKNFWFECPCHGSRYDRLGIKVQQLGPAPRSLDRFWSQVDAKGVLTVDTGKITLGPLPIALGQAGLIPPRSPTGCL